MNKNNLDLGSAIESLNNTMRQLRDENGCPWDKKQTHESLKRYLLEETYEVIETIDNKNDAKFCEELGDLLLQIVFHAQIATEENRFTLEDIIKGIDQKMQRRHPHIFATNKNDFQDIKTATNVEYMWEEIKAQENKNKTQLDNLINIPQFFPALLKAQKIQEKAAHFGFDWDDIGGAIEKLAEEQLELKNAKTALEKEEEFGDCLFSMVNIARFLNIVAEEALEKTNQKFISRFNKMNNLAQKENKNLTDLSLAEMDEFWEIAKKAEKNKK